MHRRLYVPLYVFLFLSNGYACQAPHHPDLQIQELYTNKYVLILQCPQCDCWYKMWQQLKMEESGLAGSVDVYSAAECFSGNSWPQEWRKISPERLGQIKEPFQQALLLHKEGDKIITLPLSSAQSSTFSNLLKQ